MAGAVSFCSLYTELSGAPYPRGWWLRQHQMLNQVVIESKQNHNMRGLE